METRPYVLTIAGFDPSGGAGVLADIKTFEVNKVYGQAVVTSLTFQNENHFKGLQWVEEKDIINQLDTLAEVNSLDWVKIGLIESLEILDRVIRHIKGINPECSIIWDPILKASAGFTFHQEVDKEKLIKVSEHLELITPNLNELRIMFPDIPVADAASSLSEYCNVILKGGHSEDNADDLLYEKSGIVTRLKGKRLPFDKHGTGCVFSAAILTNLAKGYDLPGACKEAKEYISDYISSHDSLLGYHYV